MAPPSNAIFPRPIPLEVSVYGTDNGIKASRYGAKRLLLNHKGSHPEGGLTPTADELRGLKGHVHIPISCTIRPRGPPNPASREAHDYIYASHELSQMCSSILELKRAGVMNPIRGDSFVFGCLRRNAEGKIVIDRAHCRQLVKMAAPFGCTFNRAFDHFADTGEWREALRQLKTLGFKGVMTSGGQGYFNTHLDRIVAMCHRLSEMQLAIAGGFCCREIGKLRREVHGFNAHSVWMNGECLRPADNEDPETADINGVMGLVDLLGLDAED